MPARQGEGTDDPSTTLDKCCPGGSGKKGEDMTETNKSKKVIGKK
jgi:hypothetical protein